MRKPLFFSALVSLALLGACQHLESDTHVVEDRPEEQAADNPSTVSGIVEVRFTSDMADYIAAALGSDSAQDDALTKALADPRSASLKASMQELGISSMSRVFPDAGKWEPRHREAGLHTWYRVVYDDSVPHTKAAASLDRIPGVAEVEIPHKITLMASGIPFSDPYNYIQWGLYNDGSKDKYRKGMDINVIPVWENYTAGKEDVIVSVVDGGIDVSHEDLQGVVIPAGENGSASFVDSADKFTVWAHNHGTHVGGIIGAVNNNGKGVSSVAGGKDGKGGVRLLSCEIFRTGSDGKDVSGNIEDAIVWGADHGAVISQNSWGFDYESEKDALRSKIPSSFKAAVDYFVKYAGFDESGKQTGPMAGGVVIFAAGNDSYSIGWPAAYENAIAVGAIRPNGRITYYSNYGPWVDICAPGGDQEGMIFSTAPAPNNYMYMMGTSQACPHVSGVAALLVSHFGGPGFTNDKLKNMLLLGAKYNAPSVSDQIGPMLDALGAFTLGDLRAPLISSDMPETVVLKSHESRSYTLKVERQISAPITSSVVSDCPAVSSEISEDGLSIKLIVNALEAKPGTYTATVKAAYLESLYSTREVSIVIEENHAPKKSAQSIPSIVVESKSKKFSLDMTQYVSDEDGEILTYTVDSSSPEKISVSASGNTLVFSPNAFGEAVFTVTASDARGESVKLNPFTFVAFDRAGQDGFTAYPNPVTDVLRLYTGMEREMSYSLRSANGSDILSGSVIGGVLTPAKLDLRSLAPGRYALTLTFDGETHTKTIIKSL